MDGEAENQKSREKDRDNRPVYGAGVFEIEESEKVATGHSLDAVLASGEFRLKSEKIRHLPQRECYQGKVQAFATGRDPAGQGTQGGGHRRRERDRQFGGKPPALDRVRAD